MSFRGSDKGPIPELRPPLADHEALAEAARCLYCYDAPCARACPANVDVAEFIRSIATGNLLGSAKRLLAANPLAAGCARVCPTEELCEGACVLPDLASKPIAIGRLQRYAMDWAMKKDSPPIPVADPAPGRVAVVGAGPAGLACAAELRRLGHAVTLYDARPKLGGLATYAIADHKVNPGFPQKEAAWLAGLGFEVKAGVRVGKDISFEALEAGYDAAFLGLGLEEPFLMSVPGEELEGVVDSLELIAAHRTGEELPVTFADRDVLIIGGGNTATDCAILALELGARRATIVYRRTRAEMPAYKAEQVLAAERGVAFRFLYAPVRVLGESTVTGLECQPMCLGEPDESGRRRPVPLDVAPETFSCDVIIRAIGQRIRDDMKIGTPPVALEHGRIKVDPETGQTVNPFYFAGGDCVNGGREVVHAAAEGRRAAQAIHRKLFTKEV